MFVVLITVVAYLIAMRMPQSIFDVATQYAFAGYSALSPLLVAALFWRRQHEVGRAGEHGLDGGGGASAWPHPADDSAAAARQRRCPSGPRSASTSSRARRRARWSLGMLPVVPMTLISALLMWMVSLVTAQAKPSAATMGRYF